MTIITISRGSYSRGKEVAEVVAERLGYECVARDVLLEAMEQFHIPEIKLIRAIHDAPSILERFGHTKEKYVACIQEAFLKRVKHDNVVYHGLAGHFFLRGISHVLKVRIIADMEDRIRLEMERENITEDEAKQTLRDDDNERRKWSQYLYGIDTSDVSLYDLTVHIRKLTSDSAAEIICDTVREEQFQATPESMRSMNDLLLSAEIKVSLMHHSHNAEVSAQDGAVTVKVRGHYLQRTRLNREITGIVETFTDVKGVHVETYPLRLPHFNSNRLYHETGSQL